MRIMGVFAHPDDETFCMGGTLARHLAEGDQVCIVILTDGVKARGGDTDAQGRALEAAMNLYCQTDQLEYGQYEYNDQELDTYPLLDIVRDIEHEISDFKPDRIYTHARQDVGQDHRRVFEAVMVAGRYVRDIFSAPSPSSTWWSAEPFRANCYIDITQYASKRDEVLLAAYNHELRESPHPRSLKAIQARAAWLAELAGINGQAEEFEIIRRLA